MNIQIRHGSALHAGGNLLLPVLGGNPSLLKLPFLRQVLLLTLLVEHRILIAEE